MEGYFTGHLSLFFSILTQLRSAAHKRKCLLSLCTSNHCGGWLYFKHLWLHFSYCVLSHMGLTQSHMGFHRQTRSVCGVCSFHWKLQPSFLLTNRELTLFQILKLLSSLLLHILLATTELCLDPESDGISLPQQRGFSTEAEPLSGMYENKMWAVRYFYT